VWRGCEKLTGRSACPTEASCLTWKDWGPCPVFLQMLILKGFKFNVLKLLIPESLPACFWNCAFQRG
jgi:hypothetical protein